MLIQLLPEQISAKWDVIKPAIAASIEGSDGNTSSNRMLMSLLNGEMQCWVSCRKEEGHLVVEGVITTQIVEDRFSGSRALLIYSLFGKGMDRLGTWEDCFHTLSTFARGHRCDKIIAYTNVRSLIGLVERLGGDASRRFVSIPI